MATPSPDLISSPEADSDLLTIWAWGATHFSSDIADAYLRDIQHAAQNLTDFPRSGVERDQLVPGMRSVVVFPSVLFYRIGAQSIDIVRIVDGRRNLAALFSKSDG